MTTRRVTSLIQNVTDYQARRDIFRAAQEQHLLSMTFTSSFGASSHWRTPSASAFPNLRAGLLWEFDRHKEKKRPPYFSHQLTLSGGYAWRWVPSRNPSDVDLGWMTSTTWYYRLDAITKKQLGLSLRLFRFDNDEARSWMANALYKF